MPAATKDCSCNHRSGSIKYRSHQQWRSQSPPSQRKLAILSPRIDGRNGQCLGMSAATAKIKTLGIDLIGLAQNGIVKRFTGLGPKSFLWSRLVSCLPWRHPILSFLGSFYLFLVSDAAHNISLPLLPLVYTKKISPPTKEFSSLLSSSVQRCAASMRLPNSIQVAKHCEILRGMSAITAKCCNHNISQLCLQTLLKFWPM